MLIALGHGIYDPDDARRRLELRLQHQRLVPVTAADRHDRPTRRDLPATVVLVAEDRGEAGSGVEPGQAEPVDRAVPADQRRGVLVTDDGVVLDRQRHCCLPSARVAWQA